MLAQAKNNSDFQRGEYAIIGGLAIQVISFGFFIIVSAVFHYRISRSPTAQSAEASVPWKKFLWILYVASAFIMIRSTFRIIQYIVGYDGVLQQHEVYVYIFDASIMFLTTFLFNVYHPSLIIRGHMREKELSAGAAVI
jgi:RTA1 like protein